MLAILFYLQIYGKNADVSQNKPSLKSILFKAEQLCLQWILFDERTFS